MESISRRKFIQLSSVTSAFLVLGCVPSGDGKQKVVSKIVDDIEGLDLNQFISISTDNDIIIFNHRPEMGQGTFQSIPMIIAEELEVDIDKVIIRQSIANRELYGSQMVVGSRSIQTEFENMRKMGAMARDMLKQAAAAKWNIPVEECAVKNGTVNNKNGASFTYGELVEEAGKLTPPDTVILKQPSEFEIIGKSFPRRDIPLKTNGQAIFGIDISVPGMLYASVERSPLFEGKIKSYNKDEILSMPGVHYVVETQRDNMGHQVHGVAVVADSYWTALQGRKALKIEWENQGLDVISSETLFNDYLNSGKMEGDELFGKGNCQTILTSSNEIIESVYETPYQAHVPMEPMNAVVSVKENEIEFWGSTQNPNGTKSFLAEKYGMPEESVKINYTFMGGGFGRRSRTDVAEEAADISQKTGVPIKVIWTREDDQTQGPFRACSVNICRGVLKKGKIEALEHKVIAQEIRNQVGEDMTAGRQLMGGITTEYLIPNFSVKGVLKKHHIPISYWRAVYHSTNPFAHECFIDELAYKAEKDPIQFRLEMLDNERFRRVLEEITKRTNWGESKDKNTGRGVAMVERSGAHFAMVAEVKKVQDEIRPIKFTLVIDLGIVVNPDTVKAQAEGSILMGLGACYTGLTIDKGAIVEQNFNTYPLLAIDQTPEIDIHILESSAPPDGAGEAGLPTVAPALANAIFDLTGKRIRKLPLDLKQLV